MNAHERLHDDHEKLKTSFQDLERLRETSPNEFLAYYEQWHQELRVHFRREDNVYYKAIDRVKSESNRDLLHTLRNDHAAIIFALESLRIRLLKGVAKTEWEPRWHKMTALLLQHFDQEEKAMFPLALDHLGQAKIVELGQLMDEIT